jgi:hypothetical protein
MATFDEVLGHPLTLLLIGAGVSSVLIPWFTNKWQDHRKKLEIKVDIASRMAEEISYQVANAVMAVDLKKQAYTDAEKNAHWENDRKWFININVIRSKLQSYYPDTDIAERWDRYTLCLADIKDATQDYFDQDPEANRRLKEQLARIKDYFSDNESISWNDISEAFDEDLWFDVIILARSSGDEIVRDVIESSIKIF